MRVFSIMLDHMDASMGTFMGQMTALKQLVDVKVTWRSPISVHPAGRFLAALSNLDGLRRCSFHADDLNYITASELGGFKQLQSLDIWTGNLVTGHILQAMQSPYLHTISISQLMKPSEGGEWRRWLEILACKFDRSLQSIRLVGRDRQNNYLPSSYSFFHVIQPITHLRYLKNIYIEPASWWYLTDDNIATLAGSWPHLESFSLELPDRRIHRSVRSLEQFAARCPMLKILRLSVGFEAGMELVKVQHTSHSLETLFTTFFWTKTGHSHPGKLIEIIERIFPRLNLTQMMHRGDYLELEFSKVLARASSK